jgi:hypothetical protein
VQLGAALAPAFELVTGWIVALVKGVTLAIPKLESLAEKFLGVVKATNDLSDASLKQVLIDNFNTLFEIENNMAEFREIASEAQLKRDVGYLRLQERVVEVQQRINDLLAERVRRAQESEKKPTAAPDDDGSPFGDGGAADEAAKHELALVTAVHEERERLSALEVAQEFEWATIMAEERERMHVEELEQEFAWATALAEARDRFNADELDQFIQKEGLLTEAKRQGEEARTRFTAMSSGQQVQHVLGSLEKMTAGIAQHSRKAFEANKLAAIGNAVINTAQGVTRALAEFPPPVSFIMAGLQAAAGAVQIQAIKKTQFQGGGQGTTPSAAGSTPTVNGQPAGAAGGGGGQRIIIAGLDPSSLFSGRAVRELAEKLIEHQKDGGSVVFAP